MLIIFVRSIIIFVVLFIVLRLMGKRQVGEMEPFEFVITLVIAELACIPINDVSIPLLYGISVVLAMLLLHRILVLIGKHSVRARSFLSGNAQIVITPKGIDSGVLSKLNLTVDDLLESIRFLGYFRFSDVQFAIVETNGKISVMPKEESTPTKPLQEVVISNGMWADESLLRIGYSKQELLSFLRKFGVSNVKDVLVLMLTEDGDAYFQKYFEDATELKIEKEVSA